jgi:hypothetical protein
MQLFHSRQRLLTSADTQTCFLGPKEMRVLQASFLLVDKKLNRTCSACAEV